MVHVSGSPTPHPAALDCQLNYATMCGPLPTFFGNMNSVPQASGTEFTQEISDQSQEQAEGYYPDCTEKETEKQKVSGSSGMCSPRTSSVAPGDLYSLTQLQDVNLNLGHATRRSARCAAASTTGRQSYRISSFQEYGGSQDVAKEKKVPLENPEEQGTLPPVRKKTRTFYSQLEELERMFQEDHYPDNEKRREIAAAVGVTPQRIMVSSSWLMDTWEEGMQMVSTLFLSLHYQVWFQNRRAKWRKMEKLSVKVSKKCPAPTTLSVPSGAISSVTDMVTCCEAGQTKAPSQGSFGSSRMECFPAIPSPPPIRRASLPLNMAFNPTNHIVPLLVGSPTPCSYPEQLEPTANLETPYYHYSNQPGTYQLPQYAPQHQLSQFHHLPIPLTSNVLPSVRLTPSTPSESNPAFFTLAGNGGVVTYGAAGASRGYLQHHIGGQILLQQPAGSSGEYPQIFWDPICSNPSGVTNWFNEGPNCSRGGQNWLTGTPPLHFCSGARQQATKTGHHGNQKY
uniref:Homeobox domain-containing protein n=1 Tax=Pelusios castaneus TaxID=367368 RepID=A0A8C8S5M3_9SAUR